MRNGALFAHPMSGPVTSGPDSSSLPTPRATRGGSSTETLYALGAERTDEDRPQGHVLLPTPSAADGMGGHERRGGERGEELLLAGLAKDVTRPAPSADAPSGSTMSKGSAPGAGNAPTVVDGSPTRLLPTPAAWDGERGPDYARMGWEDSGGDDLVTTMARLLPTPTARDHKGHNQRRDETCLTGALTAPPSPDTPPSSDDPPLTLWTERGD
jgi:hypothetical protein